MTAWRALLVALAVALLAAIALAYGAWQSLDSPLRLPEKGYVLEIESGSSLNGVLRRLHEAGVLHWREPVLWYARGRGLASRIKAGEYLLDAPLTARGLLDQLVAGRVLLHSVTLLEGWNLRQVLAALAAQPDLAHTVSADDPSALMSALGLDGASPEGQFFPDTYRFARGTTELAVLAQAHTAMTAQLESAWAERAPGLPFDTPYQALVLASLVEKETSLDAERSRIAGVFVKRLRLGMRLQSDPTVIYGLGAAFDGDLRTADLLRDGPYNSYTRAGLPPTPIAMPGAASLRAAVRPEESEALYFVATGDGGHHFSATLAEHQRAIERYLRVSRSGPEPH
jgi:peptidoglycan lytic transglycosylase G